jgi:hypothetical protein
MAAESIDSFFALAIGFAFAGMLGSGYQLLTARPASFRLLDRAPAALACAAVPFLAFAAPFIIMCNIVRGSRVVGFHFSVVMTATIVSGLWSLMSGTVTISLLTALGVFGA